MPWFNVDDGFYDHPKVSPLKMAARGLWVTAGSYCQKHLTDGVISQRQVKQLGGTRAQTDALIASGLWEQFTVDDQVFYRFHDYLNYQRSRNRVETEREQNKKRQQKHRATKAPTSNNGELSRRDTGVSHSAQSNPIQSNPLEGVQAVDTPPPELNTAQIKDPRQLRCTNHRNVAGTVPPCLACKNRRQAVEAEQQRRQTEAENNERQRIRDARNCDTCEPGGWRYGLTPKKRIYHQVKCWHTEADALEAEQCRQWEREGHQYPPTEETA